MAPLTRRFNEEWVAGRILEAQTNFAAYCCCADSSRQWSYVRQPPDGPFIWNGRNPLWNERCSYLGRGNLCARRLGLDRHATGVESPPLCSDSRSVYLVC